MNPIRRLTLPFLLLILCGFKGSSPASENFAGTLTEHLATNALARAAHLPGGYPDELEVHSPFTTNSVWAKTCWLKNAAGLAASPVNFREIPSGQGLPTMVSPRHYLSATHMHPEGYTLQFLDTNNVIHWRKTLQRTNLGGDISVGIIDQDLPASVGFVPVLAPDYTNYFPAFPAHIVQGIGMNQDLCRFSQPLNLSSPLFVGWNSGLGVPGGLGTNWNVTLRAGDSSNPVMLLIGNQLVLVSHNSSVSGGPNYMSHIAAINQVMHTLSVNNRVNSDYQLTLFEPTNWPAISSEPQK